MTIYRSNRIRPVGVFRHVWPGCEGAQPPVSRHRCWRGRSRGH